MPPQIRGRQRFSAQTAELITKRRAGARTIVATGSALVETEIKRQLTTSSHRRRTPTPSQPGQPPSLVTGTLRRSVRVTGPTAIPAGYRAAIGPTQIYSRIQELGGVAGRGAILPARPYVVPAVSTVRPRLVALAAAVWG